MARFRSGTDADIVIWGTSLDTTIRNEDCITPPITRHMKTGTARVAGRDLVPRPARLSGCQFTGRAGYGQFLHCERPTPAKPKPNFGKPTQWLDFI